MGYLIPENLRSRRDVPPGVGRLATALRDGLDEDETVWYEPLFDIGNARPDLVLLLPSRGVLVVEVLEDRASAIRGARDGQLVIAADEGGGERLVATPLARAERFADHLRRAFAASPYVGPDPLPVAAVAAFPYMSRDAAASRSLGAVLDLTKCWWREDLEAALGDREAFRAGIGALLGPSLRDPLLEPEDKAYRSIIHPDTVIGTPQLPFPTVESDPGDDLLRVLDLRQEALAKGLGTGHRVIRGAAGSGKTLVLTYRARLIAEHFPQQRVLVTCYTRALAGRLGHQLKDWPNVTVRTLDSLMLNARKAGGHGSMNFDRHSAEEMAAAALSSFDAHPKALPRFDHVLIDEAQDFCTDALRFAVALLRDGSDSLLAVADPVQNIFRRSFSWKAAGIQAVGRTRWLEQSYRNTREILGYAHSFIMKGGDLKVDGDPDPEDAMSITPPTLSPRSGPPPLFLYSPESPQAEVVNMAAHCKQLLGEGRAPGEIGVLYGRRFIGGFDWPEKLRQWFGREGLPIRWYMDPDDPKGRDLVGSEPDRITLCTIASAKGLEWNTVLLCGYLDDRPAAENHVSRSLVYVGMTRATHRLILSASGRHPFLADLERP